MKRVVIDTNVLVSSTLTAEGNSAKVFNLVSNKQIQLIYCPAILDEYKRVLAYKKLNIKLQTQRKILTLIEKLGIVIMPGFSKIPMPDESDRVFYDTAQMSKAILVTGNIKHYPLESFIMLPADFLKTLNTDEI